MQELDAHNPMFSCGLKNLQIVGEKLKGLHSIISLKCNMCNQTFLIDTNPPTQQATAHINALAIEGIMTIGGGFYNLEEFLSTLDIPCMSTKKYQHYHSIVTSAWQSTAVKSMLEAGKREANYAKEKGQVDKDGVPCIAVVADGCWSKRSYRSNYSALSGAAAIVGHQFGEVLYMGVINKYCFV